MSARLRPLLANLLLLSASLAMAAVLAEIGLRLFRPQPLEAAYVWADGTLRHRPSFEYTYTRSEFSSTVRFNSVGLRGEEVSTARRPGVPRVLFLGDSFVEGKQVGEKEVLTAVLQALTADEGRPLEVINAGIAGYGTGEELILWQRLCRGLNPDLVLVGFYPNDVRNNADRRLFELKEGRPAQVREPPLPKVRWIYDARRFLSSHSHLYMLGNLALEELAAGRRADVRDRGQSPRAGEPLEAEEVFARTPSRQVEEGWRLSLALLEELRRQVEAAGARFAVVVFPTRFQVDDALWEEHARKIGLDPARYDLRIPQRALGQWSAAAGVTVLDLLEPFRSSNVSNTFYYRLDAHWNPPGHRLAAESILAGLRAGRMIEPP